MTGVSPLSTLPSRPPAGPWGRELKRRPRTGAQRTTHLRLWLPLTPLWVVLAPFALLLAPLLTLLPSMLPERTGARVRSAVVVRPYRTAFALGAMLLALSGTVVDVDAPGARIKIRIF